MTIIGIDISKQWFDCYCSQRRQTKRFTNSPEGWKKFLPWAGSGIHVIMEASGPYYLGLASWLHEQEVTVSVANPLVIRRYGQMTLSRTKTDAKDGVCDLGFVGANVTKEMGADVKTATGIEAAYEFERWVGSPAGGAKWAKRSIWPTEC